MVFHAALHLNSLHSNRDCLWAIERGIEPQRKKIAPGAKEALVSQLAHQGNRLQPAEALRINFSDIEMMKTMKDGIGKLCP